MNANTKPSTASPTILPPVNANLGFLIPCGDERALGNARELNDFFARLIQELADRMTGQPLYTSLQLVRRPIAFREEHAGDDGDQLFQLLLQVLRVGAFDECEARTEPNVPCEPTWLRATKRCDV